MSKEEKLNEKYSYDYYIQYKGYGLIKHVYGLPKEKGINELLKYIKKSRYIDCQCLLEDLEDELTDWSDV